MGRPTLLSEDHEKKLVDYACNRANWEWVLASDNSLSYAGTYAKKNKVALKKESHETIGGVCAEKVIKPGS